MGFDPMTHRPRTDIFSSLPQLLALANLKELMDHHSLEEHALRLQAEAMAKLQYLQYLFQTPPATSVINPSPNSSNNHLNSLADVEMLKLLSSLSQLEPSGCIPSTLGSLSFNSPHENNLSFPHLPELQNPCSFQTPPSKDDHTIQAQVPESLVFEQSGNSPNSPWQAPMSSKSSSQVAFNDRPDAVINMHGEACSTLSYDAPSCSIWPELLLDDLPFSTSP